LFSFSREWYWLPPFLLTLLIRGKYDKQSLVHYKGIG
jgi:hypothetical protein